MKHVVIAVSLGVLISGNCYAADRYIQMSTDVQEAVPGKNVQLQCTAGGDWQLPLTSAKIVIRDAERTRLVRLEKLVRLERLERLVRL